MAKAVESGCLGAKSKAGTSVWPGNSSVKDGKGNTVTELMVVAVGSWGLRVGEKVGDGNPVVAPNAGVRLNVGLKVVDGVWVTGAGVV